jgi:hypothetical protein
MNNELFNVQELEARLEMEVFTGATLDCEGTCCQSYECGINLT